MYLPSAILGETSYACIGNLCCLRGQAAANAAQLFSMTGTLSCVSVSVARVSLAARAFMETLLGEGARLLQCRSHKFYQACVPLPCSHCSHSETAGCVHEGRPAKPFHDCYCWHYIEVAGYIVSLEVHRQAAM